MKIIASNTQQVAQSIAKSTNQVFQDKVKVSENPSFQERLGDGLKNVTEVQKDAAEIAKKFRVGNRK
jgi:flagellar hook-basal body complex protein FliE